MIVRELITKLGFNFDGPALRKAEQNINDFKKRAAATGSHVHKSLAQTLNDFDAAQARQRMNVLADSTQKVAYNARAARNSTRSMSADTFETASNIGLMLKTYLSFLSVRNVAGIADQAQNLRARLGFVPQTENAAATFDEVVKNANAARVSLEAYGRLYVRLAGATKDFLPTQSEVLQVTSAITQALTINGATTAEATSVTLQLSQAFQKGKLDGDEFRSFMENLSDDFKEKTVVALKGVTGNANITVGSLYEMSRSGELVAKDLALAFKKMAPEIEKQMLLIPLSIGQSTQIASNRFTQMIDRMNRETMFVSRIAAIILGAFDLIESSVYGVASAVGGFGNAARLAGIMIGLYFIKQLELMNKQLLLSRIRFLGAFAGLALLALLIGKVHKMLSSDKPFMDEVANFGQKIKNGYGFLFESLGLQKGSLESSPLFSRNADALRQASVFQMPTSRPSVEVFRPLPASPMSSKAEVNVNVTLPPGTTTDQVPIWAMEIDRAIDKTLARNITSTVGGR
jgi:tape measure domain-containing protein